MKKFSITLEPSPLLKEELTQVHPPPKPTPTWTLLEDQPSTSRDNLQSTMAQIEAVWEARMNTHIADQLIEHDSAMNKKFAELENKSIAKFNVMERNMGDKFDDLEANLRTKVDILESNLIDKLDPTKTTMISKIDVMETKLTSMVNQGPRFGLSDLDSDFDL